MKRSRAFPGGEPVQNTGIYAALRRTEGSRGIILDSNGLAVIWEMSGDKCTRGKSCNIRRQGGWDGHMWDSMATACRNRDISSI